MAYDESYGEFLRNERYPYDEYDYTQHANPVFKAALAAALEVERLASIRNSEADKAYIAAVGVERIKLAVISSQVHIEYCDASEATMAIWGMADSDGRKRLVEEDEAAANGIQAQMDTEAAAAYLSDGPHGRVVD